MAVPQQEAPVDPVVAVLEVQQMVLALQEPQQLAVVVVGAVASVALRDRKAVQAALVS